MSNPITCSVEPGCDRPATVHCITREGVTTGCRLHVLGATSRKRDKVNLPVYPADALLDRAGRDYLTDVAVEAIEHHLQLTPVAVELVVVYRALTGDGTWTGAVVPVLQGDTVTEGLLADLAPDIASRVEGEVSGDE